MSDTIEKKKVDVYSLYKKEKTIRVEDDEGNYIDVLLVKMTQGERLSALNAYNEYLDERRLKLREREERLRSLSLAIERYAKDDLIIGLIAFESAQRSEIADLYPALEGKSEEERAKIVEDELEKFRAMRKEELQKDALESLRKRFVDMTIESQALLDSVRVLNYLSLVAMCFDAETKEKLFKSIDDVEKICDRRVVDALIEEMTAFRALEMPKETRKIASSDSNFLAPGESQKS